MSKKIYPECARVNFNAGTYCEIAMESFYNATNYFTNIAENKFSVSCLEERSQMEKEIIKAIVFSAMTIESFINDYAAACLGDDEFYSNFDKLSTISKFQLISKFILKSEIDKSASYYSHLKALFKLRDVYVHNKSHQFTGFNDVDSLEDVVELFTPQDEDAFILDKEDITNDYQSALNALKAIKEITEYFEQYDEAGFVNLIFGTFGLQHGSSKEKEYKSLVFSKLNIKVDK